MSAATDTEGQLLRAIADRKGENIAELMGISASRFSELKSQELVGRCAKLVVACGFRLQPAGEPTFDPAHVQAMETLARLYMRQREAS